jgi:hypothetical protein
MSAHEELEKELEEQMRKIDLPLIGWQVELPTQMVYVKLYFQSETKRDVVDLRFIREDSDSLAEISMKIHKSILKCASRVPKIKGK